jgi:uncharacterized protein (TIGR00725 family)
MPIPEVRQRPVVAVIGGARCTTQEDAWAEAVGRALAERGALVVCGGRSGVMEAACRGAKAGGGLTIGILPGTRRDDANPFVDVVVTTGIGEARNAIVVRTAQAAVAVGGEYGTLSEIAFALKRGLPVAGLGTWDIARGSRFADAIFRADSPAGAVAWVLGELEKSEL